MPKSAKLEFITTRFVIKALLLICILIGFGLVFWSGKPSIVSVTDSKSTSTEVAKVEQTAVTNQPPVSSSAQSSTTTQKPASNDSSQTKSSTSVSSNVSDIQTQAPTLVTASLLVNGTNLGSLTVTADSTQCDLLKQALSKGVISQLTMNYNSSFKSYGVYKINNQGNENNVRWVYEVNDISPLAGCSGVVVKNGDSVNWKYLK